MSVPFLLCRNGTDCKRNGLSVPFLLFSPFHLMPPVLITRARGDLEDWSQNDRANRLSASRLLRNLALQLLGPAVNHRALQPALYRTYTSRGCGRTACCRSSPLYCVSCKLERFFLLMHVALAAISSLYKRTESARYRPTSRACLQSGKDRNGTSVS